MSYRGRDILLEEAISLIRRLKYREFEDQYELLGEVCNDARLSMGEVLYKRGEVKHSLTRHALWYLFREKFGWGPSRIERETGRDHSTISVALKNLDDHINGNEQI